MDALKLQSSRKLYSNVVSLVHWPLMGGLLHLVQQGGSWVGCGPTPPSPLLTVPHVTRLAVWLSGNALASINVVALRQTRLVLGWVTVCGRVNHFSM